MTSSTSSSSSVLAAAAVAVCLLAAPIAGAATPDTPALPLQGIQRVAVFPVENLAVGGSPDPTLRADVAAAVQRAGLQAIPTADVDRFLAERRIRYTAGLSREVARLVREELRVDGVVLTDVLQQGRPGEVLVSVTMRVVTTGEPPVIAWMNGFARTGDDAPGLLQLGVVREPERLRREALAALSESLREHRRGDGAPGVRCASGKTWAPKLSYRLRTLDEGATRTVVVLPFSDSTARRPNAGEVVRLQVVQQLASVPGLRVVELGDVRESLLAYRIILRGGVSLSSARTMLDILRADWVVVGEVRRFDDAHPAAEFNVHILNRADENVIWHSRSYNDGSDGVVFFNRGRVSTTSTLVCRMAAEIVERAFHRRDGRPARQAAGPGAQ